MEHNELSSLPSSAANLAKLEVLNVANNKLSSLAVLATPSLTHLNADNNAISVSLLFPFSASSALLLSLPLFLHVHL